MQPTAHHPIQAAETKCMPLARPPVIERTVHRVHHHPVTQPTVTRRTQAVVMSRTVHLAHRVAVVHTVDQAQAPVMLSIVIHRIQAAEIWLTAHLVLEIKCMHPTPPPIPAVAISHTVALVHHRAEAQPTAIRPTHRPVAKHTVHQAQAVETKCTDLTHRPAIMHTVALRTQAVATSHTAHLVHRVAILATVSPLIRRAELLRIALRLIHRVAI
mmetsp:Transcript_40337/g.64650  ORF Transcript_40337/g.64650 Transcript_40337/m.64650 type:complete len:214 (+) Transcript_40337:326-967(+)